LRQAQRAWLAFRDVSAQATAALIGTRHGTMYVPLQAGRQRSVMQDRAVDLETQLRILTIDD
jgi:uncharacterized protein YecT (DUF1311 family)